MEVAVADLEARFEEALKATGVAGNDPMFRIAILVRRECRAARRRIVGGCALASVVAILMWIGRSAVGELLGSDIGHPDWIAMAAVTFAALLTIFFAGTPLVRRALA